ncbi:helix-turn-helix domain-containing protein [Streptomyces albus]|uniref:helix-turn-helix domain-containing protein n=1 Tax=Streptomyces sp. NRRL F-5639 TaxID=1463867 RepID=UPI0004C5CF16|nr:helix-turn-helix transcriptional regulator [Streptomyces sp. NRRL F-5639]
MSTRSHPDGQSARTRTTPSTNADRAARYEQGLRAIAEDLHVVIESLLLGAHNNVPSVEIARRSQEIEGLNDELKGTLVVRERALGRPLAGIADTFGRSEDRLRKKYPFQDIDRCLLDRKPSSTPRQARKKTITSSPQQPVWRSPIQRLAAALSRMVKQSPYSQRELARLIGLSPSYISRMVTGTRRASWQHVARMCEVCLVDPELLRPLWEVADGVPMKTDDPAGYLRTYLRALHYAAGSPSEDAVLASMSALTVHQLRQALHGPDVPDWGVIAQVVTALQGLSRTARPMWERARNTPTAGPDSATGPLSAESFG